MSEDHTQKEPDVLTDAIKKFNEMLSEAEILTRTAFVEKNGIAFHI